MDLEERTRMYERLERSTEAPMLVLALIFLIIIVARQIFSFSEGVELALIGIEWMIWGAFAIELVAKTYLAPGRLRYLLRNWMMVIIVIFPFLRPLQLLRIVAIGARSWKSIRAVLLHQTAGVIGLAGVVFVFVSAFLVWGFEQTDDGPIRSLPDALWWSVTTITTVGYGDMYPVTAVGRGIAVFLMIAGISLFGLLTARVAAFFVDEEELEEGAHAVDVSSRLDQVLERLESIEEQNRKLREQVAMLQTQTGDSD